MPTTASNLLPRYQFGDLTLDLGQRRLNRGKESLELGKLTFDFLRVLVESSPNVVTYDELAEKAWDGRPVSPETVTQRAKMLRHALSDDADHPRYFEVLRSQGYRLMAPVTIVEPASNDQVSDVAYDRLRGRKLEFAIIGLLAVALLGVGGFWFMGRDARWARDEAFPQIEAYAEVRDFVETGGDVLLVIAVVTFGMWLLILERYWFFSWVHPKTADAVQEQWDARSDHQSWFARQIRLLLLTDVDLELQRGLQIIKSLVALCPMLGLLGTVTGMIEVFDVMAIAGSGNVRGMAGGISKATLPTMAGMVAALSGLIFSVQLERRARRESQRMFDRLILTHG